MTLRGFFVNAVWWCSRKSQYGVVKKAGFCSGALRGRPAQFDMRWIYLSLAI
jgi:hypothetical protein